MKRLRSVEHDNGLFSFLVPIKWTCQIEDDGTQVFWDEDAGSGTLRVTSLTATKDAVPDSLPQLELLPSGAAPAVREDGVAWVHYRQNKEEDGKATVMFWWQFAHFVPPRYARIAFFSFTIYASEENEPATQSQLEVLRELPSIVKFGALQDFEQ